MPIVCSSKGQLELSNLAAAERERGYLTNVSVWDSLEAAHQMDTLIRGYAIEKRWAEVVPASSRPCW